MYSYVNFYLSTRGFFTFIIYVQAPTKVFLRYLWTSTVVDQSVFSLPYISSATDVRFKIVLVVRLTYQCVFKLSVLLVPRTEMGFSLRFAVIIIANPCVLLRRSRWSLLFKDKICIRSPL